MNVKSMVSFQQNSPYNVEKAKLKSSSNGGNYLFELKKNSFCVNKRVSVPRRASIYRSARLSKPANYLELCLFFRTRSCPPCKAPIKC